MCTAYLLLPPNTVRPAADLGLGMDWFEVLHHAVDLLLAEHRQVGGRAGGWVGR